MAPLRLHYSITAEDLAEARRRWMIDPAMLSLICGAIACLLLLPQAIRPDVPLVIPQPPKAGTAIDLLMPLVQWGGILLIIWFPLFQIMRRTGRQPWQISRQRQAAPSSVRFWICLSVAFAATVAAAAVAISAKRKAAVGLGAAVDPNYSPAFETLFSIFPFVLMCVFIPLIIHRANNSKRFWSRQYHLHRPFTTEIDEGSLRVSEPFVTVAYRWAYFRGFTQSPNLFHLYPTSLQLVMIPKRAFATPEARQEFADFLARTIVPPATAFPVLPALPLPALPAGPSPASAE